MQKFCETCHELVDFTVKDELKEKDIRGTVINYLGKESYCDVCGTEIFVSELRDFNLKQLDAVFRKDEGLITVSEINQILEQYNIGKRPLSKVLGWGEGTLTRYLNGDIPTKQYSDTLMRIQKDYHLLEELLDQNKNEISDLTHRKSKEAISRMKTDMIMISEKNKIGHVAKYLIEKCDDITPLALQKLLYYSQAFHNAFYKEYLFENDCEAWVHGPVYREVYNEYKNYSFNPIEAESLEKSTCTLSSIEIELLDSIVQNFGCYSGKILESMTHIEYPWISTRRGLDNHDPCNKIINKELIDKYFEHIKLKYNMLTLFDIKDYSNDLFQKVN